MLRVTSAKIKGKSGRVKYRGISDAARRLKVTRIHLYLVLEGKRVSHSLSAKPEFKKLRGSK